MFDLIRHFPGRSRDRREPVPHQRRAWAWLLLAAAVASSGCASAPNVDVSPAPATHRPVYMSWEELRTTAVQVEAPRPVRRRGKLLATDGLLFLSERGEGVHVFLTADPNDPRALMFIRIPGTTDVLVRGLRLYADSFVDLLVFDLDVGNATARLVNRVEDCFDYDPYQTLTSDTPVSLRSAIDKAQGVVIRLEPIQASKEPAR
ncbi:MAG: hypothetical protein HOV80_02305 [Polyangiaceae bacterium]|nr:hypothetical protein [Polyangiaceae bacterium]